MADPRTLNVEVTAQGIARVEMARPAVFNAFDDEAREGFAAFLDKRPAAWIKTE